jgi:hypothetical protein
MTTSSTAVGVALALLIALTGCGPSAPAATPSTSAGPPSPAPAASGTPTTTPQPTASEEVVTAVVVVVTASTLSVFGADGSTLVAVDYEADAAAVAAQLADALGTAPRVSTTAEATEACPTRTLYDFGGLVLGTPQSLGSPATQGLPGTYDVVVTTSAIGPVAVETVAGQQIGATRFAFAAAIGDEATIEGRGSGSDVAFDIVNPADDPFDQIGTYAVFDGDALTTFFTPAVVRFVGGCS